MVTFEDFKKIEMRIASIKEVKAHPNADKLFVMKIDTGSEEKEIVAGIRGFYEINELVGKKIVVITNLEPATIRGVKSSAMLLAASDEKTMSLIVPEKDVKLGSRIS